MIAHEVYRCLSFIKAKGRVRRGVSWDAPHPLFIGDPWAQKTTASRLGWVTPEDESGQAMVPNLITMMRVHMGPEQNCVMKSVGSVPRLTEVRIIWD